MIDSTTPVFPNNVVELLSLHAQLIDLDLQVFKRPLNNLDPTQSVGVFATQWQPDLESFEMRGHPPGPSEATVEQYYLGIQAFVKDMDPERGLATHSVLSKLIRSMLYRDDALRVGLRGLSVTVNGETEVLKRWSVRTQRYFSNEISGSFLYLSTLEVWLETENL